jgi:hypothetical protein
MNATTHASRAADARRISGRGAIAAAVIGQLARILHFTVYGSLR